MLGHAVAGLKYPWILIAGIVAFAAIAFWTLAGFSQSHDQRLFLELAGWARADPALMHLLTFMSAAADSVFRVTGAALLATVLFLVRKSRVAWFVIIATAGGAALCLLAKVLAARARPDLLPHLDGFRSFSFPSGHAWNGFIFFGEIALVAALFLPRLWRVPVVALGVLAAFLTGWARIALGVHWPSDVLAGWIGGGTWLMLCYGLLLGAEAGRTSAKSIVDP